MALPKVPELWEFSQFSAPSIADRYSVIAVPYLTMLNSIVLLSETLISAVNDSASREKNRKIFIRFLTYAEKLMFFLLVASRFNSPFL